MKKSIVSIALCTVLIFCMGVVVFATDTVSGGTSQIVTGRCGSAAEGSIVYSVTLEWGSLEFTYEVPADIWNPSTHRYEQNETAEPTWTCAEGADTVTVTNRSNADVDVQVTTSMSADNIAATVENDQFTLNSADANVTEENPVGRETKGVARISLAGKLPSSHKDGDAIGSVTVILSATQPTEPTH